MPFDRLFPQPKMGPVAEAYAEEILARSRVVAETTRAALDIPYGSDACQRLDLYFPDDSNAGSLPVLIFLHGGGWEYGYKEWMGFMAPSFTDLPAIFVSVGYRLLPAHRFPAQLDDTITALAWVHANIARFGGSPEKLFIGGHSAGGHLSALATLSRDLVGRAGLPAGVIRACFPVSAVCEFKPGELEARGKHLLARPEDATEASPITHVADNKVPFYIVWGDADLEYVMRTCPPMVDALRQAGSRVEYAVFAGEDHFQPNLDGGNRDSEWVQTVRRWMQEA